MTTLKKDAPVYIAGHNGMIGSALVRKLKQVGFTNLILRSREELDLLSQQQVLDFFAREKPAYVFLAAGKVGGVFANDTYRADFIYENLTLQNNIIHASYLNEVTKLIFFACASLYPRNAPQPIKEDYLLTGPLEATSEPFALAKITGIKMIESFNRQYGTDYISILPSNTYGPNQKYDPLNSLVVPSLIQKFVDAKRNGIDEVSIWGSGKAIRDFICSDDLADAAIFLMENYSGNDLFNIGTGEPTSIATLANIIKQAVGYEGNIRFDKDKPEGALVNILDVTRIEQLGWKAKIPLEEGIPLACEDYQSRKA